MTGVRKQGDEVLSVNGKRRPFVLVLHIHSTGGGGPDHSRNEDVKHSRSKLRHHLLCFATEGNREAATQFSVDPFEVMDSMLAGSGERTGGLDNELIAFQADEDPACGNSG